MPDASHITVGINPTKSTPPSTYPSISLSFFMLGEVYNGKNYMAYGETCDENNNMNNTSPHTSKPSWCLFSLIPLLYEIPKCRYDRRGR